jgi:hypothetical protein
MPNYNLKLSVICPNCNQERLSRGDVVRKAQREGKQLFCKPCRNKLRFAEVKHPRFGTGVKNDPALKYTVSSFYKAKQRCVMGARHHPAYENVEFKFASFQEFVDCVGVRPQGMSLDRINPLGHYEAGNVRWATIKQQAENRLPKGYWQKQT